MKKSYVLFDVTRRKNGTSYIKTAGIVLIDNFIRIIQWFLIDHIEQSFIVTLVECEKQQLVHPNYRLNVWFGPGLGICKILDHQTGMRLL